VLLRADLRDANNAVATRLYVSLGETRGDPWPRSLNVDFEDPVFGTPSPLAGHILHARLLNATGQSVQEIETTPGNENTKSIISRTVFFNANETDRYDAMRELFLSGRTVLEVETDLPGLERVRVALPVSESTGWVKNSCD
ncbi:MAG: hypothetical protein ACREBE_04810, partial [bacterium]